jgi:lytic murein transglycosylase
VGTAARTGLLAGACGLLFAAVPSAAFAQPAAFRACLAELRGLALARGIAAPTVDTAFFGLEPDEEVLRALEDQPEFRLSIWDYLAALVDEERVADGRARLAAHSALLDEIERRYGVDRHVVVAFWGVKTDYGRVMGRRPLVRSLATLSCNPRRQGFFRGELMATLRILEGGDVAPDALVGSWAGAFGQTQFMPTTWQRLAVDFDGDGRRDIVGSVADALGSTANYLQRAGWVTGQPWGMEVRIPAGYGGPSGRGTRLPLAKWAALGIRMLDGAPPSGEASAALLLPAGPRGPAFLTLRNFNAIYAYNAAESYALSVAHLADRLRGAPGFATPWPTDDPGLSRAERREVQERLAQLGADLGKPDGIIGSRTRAAILDFQKSRGLRADGRAGLALLKTLRAQVPAADAGANPGVPEKNERAGSGGAR